MHIERFSRMYLHVLLRITSFVLLVTRPLLCLDKYACFQVKYDQFIILTAQETETMGGQMGWSLMVSSR